MNIFEIVSDVALSLARIIQKIIDYEYIEQTSSFLFHIVTSNAVDWFKFQMPDTSILKTPTLPCNVILEERHFICIEHIASNPH